MPRALESDSSHPPLPVIPGLVPGIPPSAAKAEEWRASAPKHYTVG
jgi:hypothetical protein